MAPALASAARLFIRRSVSFFRQADTQGFNDRSSRFASWPRR